MHPETILSGERWGSAQAAPCPRRGPRAVKLDLVEAAVVKQEVHAFPRSGLGVGLFMAPEATAPEIPILSEPLA